MRKRVLSLLLVLSLLMSLPLTGFAEKANITGYSYLNPAPFNTEMKINDVKTKNGTWKNVGIKVSEMKVDNTGYQSALVSNGLTVNKGDLEKYDALKVKVNYTFSGFTGNKNGFIKDNLFVKSIMAMQPNAEDQEKGQLYAKFPNALNNIVEKYSVGGKTFKGLWVDKKIKDVNFSKPVTMSGYVYLIVEKGKTTNVLANFELYPQKNSNLSNVYIAMTKAVTEPKLKETGSYLYGNETVGIFKSPFEMAQTKESKEDTLSYFVNYNGEEILTVDLMAIDTTDRASKEVDAMVADLTKTATENFGVKAIEESNLSTVVGVVPDSGNYLNFHVIRSDKKVITVMIVSALTEKLSADKLWDSYKSSNDLNAGKGSAELNSTPKETSKKPLGKYTYGTDNFGKIGSLVELFPVPNTEAEILRYASKSGDTFAVLQFFDYSKPSMDNLDTNTRENLPNASVGTLDQGNIIAYVDNGYSDGSIISLTVVRGNKIYTIILGLPLNADAQKEIMIKTYLMSIGYTEQQAETISTSAIFD